MEPDKVVIDIKTWWDIAQLAGAGAAFVLGVVCWFLWFQWRNDVKEARIERQETEKYIRESQKNTLIVLNELTKQLEKFQK